MKILFLNHNLIWRGSFFRCLGFARELVKQGHQVDLWTASNKHNPEGRFEEIDGVRVWQTPRFGNVSRHDGGYAPIDIVKRMVSITGFHWDVVHAFEHRPNVILPWIWKRLQHKSSSSTLFLADWSDWWTGGGIITAKRKYKWMDRTERFIEEKSKVWADGVTVISQALYDRALSIGVSPESIALIPSGIDCNPFPCLDRTECRKTLSLPLNKVILGFAGFSLWDMKLLADTFAMLRQRQKDVSLLVIGGGVEESQKDIFRSRFQVDDEVFLPGVVPFHLVPQWLGCCDILLLPMEENVANQARLPNKLMDYLAAGRPIVITNVSDAARIVIDNDVGTVCQSNAGSMAKACFELITDQQKASNQGKNARETAQKKYDYSVLIEKWVTFYQMQFKIKSNPTIMD